MNQECVRGQFHGLGLWAVRTGNRLRWVGISDARARRGRRPCPQTVPALRQAALAAMELPALAKSTAKKRRKEFVSVVGYRLVTTTPGVFKLFRPLPSFTFPAFAAPTFARLFVTPLGLESPENTVFLEFTFQDLHGLLEIVSNHFDLEAAESFQVALPFLNPPERRRSVPEFR